MALDILIVDDSAAIRKILQRVLGQTEIPMGSVYEAGDGAAALEILKKQTSRPGSVGHQHAEHGWAGTARPYQGQ